MPDVQDKITVKVDLVQELSPKDGLAQDLRELKEQLRSVAGLFFDVKEKEAPVVEANPFFNAVGKPTPQYPQISYAHSGCWRGAGERDNQLPDPKSMVDGFGNTPEEDQKLGALWRDYIAASRRRQVGS